MAVTEDNGQSHFWTPVPRYIVARHVLSKEPRPRNLGVLQWCRRRKLDEIGAVYCMPTAVTMKSMKELHVEVTGWRTKIVHVHALKMAGS